MVDSPTWIKAMGTKTPTPPKPEDWRESPTAWFAALEAAMNRGDLSAAADAQHELARLGVAVRYRPQRQAVTR